MTAPRHVLVVDDQADTCEATALALSDDGYVVSQARNASDALRLVGALPSNTRCVVLSGLRVPKREGLELNLTIRGQLTALRARILVMSTSSRSVDLRGADGFLQKPYWPDHLRATVAGLFDSFDDRRELTAAVH